MIFWNSQHARQKGSKRLTDLTSSSQHLLLTQDIFTYWMFPLTEIHRAAVGSNAVSTHPLAVPSDTKLSEELRFLLSQSLTSRLRIYTTQTRKWDDEFRQTTNTTVQPAGNSNSDIFWTTLLSLVITPSLLMGWYFCARVGVETNEAL